jgi:nicotinate-nucleotide pyrophosphorylase (carboxylating)
MTLSPLLIEDAVRAALKEDLGHGFDATAQAVVPGDAMLAGRIVSRENGILAGLIPGMTAFTFTDPDFSIEIGKQDGDLLEPGDVIAAIEGPARALLTAERTALNFMTHMSGIATLTARYVQEVEGTGARIACTRKTLPGLRAFQKYAVVAGGGVNHRFGLDDAILIKDNHIAVAGGIEQALESARASCGHMMKIEIEVDTLKQLDAVLKHGGADVVMLDNFSLKDLKAAVKKISGAMITEASGGVTLNTVRAIAETGVDVISVGAITHSAPALDIALDI